MKLRIKGNSLRIRVGRSELERFLDDGRVEDTIHFAPQPEARLTYVLESSAPESTETNVRYHRRLRSFLLPIRCVAGAWKPRSGSTREYPLERRNRSK
jgi:hypothetical protein